MEKQETMNTIVHGTRCLPSLEIGTPYDLLGSSPTGETATLHHICQRSPPEKGKELSKYSQPFFANLVETL